MGKTEGALPSARRRGAPREGPSLTPQGKRVDDLLAEIARPDLYRRNGFRLGGLDGSASSADLRRCHNQSRLAARFGGPPPLITSLPFDPMPSPAETEEALMALREDSLLRLVSEILWIWPDETSSDFAVSLRTLFRQMRVGETADWWQEQKAIAQGNAVATHNIAVLTHARVLDLEAVSDLCGRDKTLRNQLWTVAFECWGETFASDDFWERVKFRASTYGDPRVTSHTASRIREVLPSVLLSINTCLAVQAFTHSDKKEGARHISIVRKAGFEKASVDRALEIITVPAVRNLRTLATDASDRVDPHPEDGRGIARRLLQEAMPTLEFLDAALGKPSPTCKGIRDEVARRLLQCTVAYANKTEDWSEVENLLLYARDIAATDSVRSKIEENLRIARSNNRPRFKEDVCAFCERHSPDEDAAEVVKFYRNVTIDSSRSSLSSVACRYESTEVRIPQCRECAKTIQSVKSWSEWGQWAASRAKKSRLKKAGYLPKWYSVDELRGQPPIRMLLNDGWKIGEPTESDMRAAMMTSGQRFFV